MMGDDDRAAQSTNYGVVSANSIDAERLIDFASRVWPDRRPHERILSSWWRHVAPSCANALVHHASGAMVGLCAGRPSEWIIANQVYPAVSICDFFVDARHGGKLLGRRLLRTFEAPGRLMNAISISDVAVAYVKRMGWVGPHTSTLMAIPLPLLAKVTHALLVKERGLVFKNYAISGGSIPDVLKHELNRIDAMRAPDEPARMRRGGREWEWRVSIYPDRVYRFCIAYRGVEPVGYVVTRRVTSGRSRLIGRVPAALIVDLLAAHNDPGVLEALAARAIATAAKLSAVAAIFITTAPCHRDALTAIGFLSPRFPVFGRMLRAHAPSYMWLPRGAGVDLKADQMTMTFADSALDLDL
jgi:hypothetical protein